jgi:hypothetical protein
MISILMRLHKHRFSLENKAISRSYHPQMIPACYEADTIILMMFAEQAEVEMQPARLPIGGTSDLQRPGWRRGWTAGFAGLVLAGYGLILAPPVAAMPSQSAPSDARGLLSAGDPGSRDATARCRCVIRLEPGQL